VSAVVPLLDVQRNYIVRGLIPISTSTQARSKECCLAAREALLHSMIPAHMIGMRFPGVQRVGVIGSDEVKEREETDIRSGCEELHDVWV